jgi:hypothetical protein
MRTNERKECTRYTGGICFNVQSTPVHMFQCTEYSGCTCFNVQSTLVVHISMYRVHWLYMFQCAEYSGCICFNVQSTPVVYASISAACIILQNVHPLEPCTQKCKAEQMTTLHQLPVQLPDTRQVCTGKHPHWKPLSLISELGFLFIAAKILFL